jgi:urease accessory protein
MLAFTNYDFLSILQLASPNLPVGAYSYSEGLETLVENGVIVCASTLKIWVESELAYGSIRLDALVMNRAYNATLTGDMQTLQRWNLWLSAARDTEELRAASWQMGRSLQKLITKLAPQTTPLYESVDNPCNYAIALGIAAAHWQINPEATILAYLYSWANNLVTAGVKLVPLGQTAGQEILLGLQELLSKTAAEILILEDNEIACCSWGLSLASMQHEKQYTRLFRS